jgi:hypothetical protein
MWTYVDLKYCILISRNEIKGNLRVRTTKIHLKDGKYTQCHGGKAKGKKESNWENCVSGR